MDTLAVVADRNITPLLTLLLGDKDLVVRRRATQLLRKPHLAETKIYVDPPPGAAGGGHTFNRRVDARTLERQDTPEQIDSWNRVWTFFEWTLRTR